MTLLYLSGCHYHYKYLKDFNNIGYLVSYYYLEIQKSNKDFWNLISYCQDNNIPIMLDSGAYTAMTKNITIDNKKYIEFCKKHGNKFTTIVSLDVIGNWKETKKNYNEMRKSGIVSLPTFHIGSPFSEYEKLIDKEDYIGIGGIAGKGNQKKTISWLKYIDKLTNGNKQFHGFGVTTPKLLSIFNWHSIDGTTPVTAAIIYGRIMLNVGQGRIKWIAMRNKKQIEKYWPLIKDEFNEAWDFENETLLPRYSEISLRFNIRNLLEIIHYYDNNKKKNMQEYLL